MLDWFRGRGRRINRRPVQRCLELPGHQPVVGRVVGEAEGDRLPLDSPQGEVHLGGRPALDFAQQLRVHAELENGRGLGVAGQLGVPDLVAPVSEAAGLGDPHEEVGGPQPLSVEEHRLVDDIGPGAHRIESEVPPLGQTLAEGQPGVLVEPHDFNPVGLQGLQEALLVELASLGNPVQHRVFAHRPFQMSRDRGALEAGQVPAFQESHKVRGRVDQVPIDDLHPPSPPCFLVALRSRVQFTRQGWD